MKPLRYLFLFVFLFFSTLVGNEPELLEPHDVQRIMQQIFSQHVDKKQMSIPILKNSFKVYIDQFDPERMYLLEQEVEPFLSFSDDEIQKIMSQYTNNEFPEYYDLNSVIQKSIVRAREIRNELEKERDEILRTSKKYSVDNGDEWHDPDLDRPFPKTLSEIKDRIKHALIRFVVEERKRYGESQVQRYETQIFNLYENHIQDYENNYLFVNPSGNPLLEADKQNLFILHVLKSLANSLDAHTTFFAPSEAYDMKVRLEKEFLGIGAIIKKSPEGNYYIARLIEGSSAAKSGLVKINDQIVEIDGQPIIGESFKQVNEMLQGKNGSKVSLNLRRLVDEGFKQTEKNFNVTLTRAPIIIHDDRVDVSYENFGNGIIGKVTLYSFYQSEDGISSEKDIREAIKKLQKIGNLRGLILDLRENSGGFLSQAVKVAGLFITNGIVVVSKYSSGEERFYRDMESKKIYDGPLIILTSKATASAAEIVAQALQDYGLALVVGDEHTYGKGTIQSQTVTGNQGTSVYFKVTIGKYYTVSGKTPQIQGVKADIVAPSQFAWENLGEEYLEYPLEQDKIPPAYHDTLNDIDPSLKPWYMKYYVPTIQQQKDMWRNMIPSLKKNSVYRIAHNKEYQHFLQQGDEKNRKNLYMHHSGRRINVADLQMAEAVNVVKDMITLESRARSSGTLVDTVKQQSGKIQAAGITEDVLR